MITENRAVVEGRELYYQLITPEGSGRGKPVLVFLHEGLGSTQQWRDFPESISRLTGHPALVYDRYGYGRSQVKPEVNDIDYMHTEAWVYLPGLLNLLEITDRIILVGHSDGGTIALLFAARFPARTHAVISECDHVICETITRDGVLNLVKEYGKGKLKKMLSTYHGNKTDILFRGWTGLWLSEVAPDWNILEELTSVKAPVLAIQGANDNYGSPAQLSAKLERVGGAIQVNLLPDCGHVPHFMQRETVTRLMTEFISNL